MYINKTTNQVYTGGVLRTPKGNINNPSLATLREWGFVPMVSADTDNLKEEVQAQRKQAYIQRVDPITAEISRLRDMGGTAEEIADAMARREQEVSAIKAELPYPTEE